MPDEKRNIFYKVQKREELNSIIQAMSSSSYEIQAKLPSSAEDILLLSTESFIRNELGCRIKQASKHISIPETGTLVIQVQLGDEKILAQPRYELRSGNIYLNMDCDFFQLQRREDFRLRVPASFRAELKIQDHNASPAQYTGKIIDISSGGCRFENHRRDFQVLTNDQIKGQLCFTERPDVAISGIIRHIAPLPENIEAQLVGVQFLDLDGQARNRIFALIMDIHRKHFSKLL